MKWEANANALNKEQSLQFYFSQSEVGYEGPYWKMFCDKY